MDRRSFLIGTAAFAACRAERPLGTEPIRPELAPVQRTIVAGRGAVDGDRAQVHRLFPSFGGDHHDPFVLLDEFRVAEPAGFPMHPHRGFEAFTYMLDGAFHHQDTMGNDSVVRTGGTQRFTSGRGARHSEMPRDGGGHGLQLWVNLPPEKKRIAPTYGAVSGADIPETGRRGVIVRTVVGPTSPVELQTPMSYEDVRLETGAEYGKVVPADHAGFAYVIEGEARIGDQRVTAGSAALLARGDVAVRGPTRVAIVHGKQHGAPIRQRGPYVD
ncbi:MAG: pirin family protein [Myxococcota bacterium]